jgi:N-acetylmuramoyl-L-alanine amidase
MALFFDMSNLHIIIKNRQINNYRLSILIKLTYRFMHSTSKIRIIVTYFDVNSGWILSQSTFKVTLDAGHGAHDFGAVYEGRIENILL